MFKALTVLVVLASIATACQTITNPVAFISTEASHSGLASVFDADVIVVGSSLAGWSAAIASARSGADTILISETSCIGGQAACAGVSTWDGTGLGLDRAFRDGLTAEYRKADVQLGGCYATTHVVGPDTFQEGSNFCPNPSSVEKELLSWLNTFNVRLVGPVDVLTITTNGSVVTTDGILSAKVVVEATETGELIPASLRRLVSNECKQKLTWVASVREPGVGGDKVKDFMYPTDPMYMSKLTQWWSDGSFHWAGLTGEQGLPVYRRTHDLNGDLVIQLNWMNDALAAETSLDMTFQMIVFLGQHGYGNWRWSVFPIPYHRTSNYRLNGQQQLGSTERNVDSFPNSVTVSNYYADAHGGVCGFTPEPFGNYDVPMGIGVPAARVPILVAMPRSTDVSDTRATSFRMQPDEITWGEAVGVLAALSVKQGVLPHDVPVEDVRSTLVAYGARVDV